MTKPARTKRAAPAVPPPVEGWRANVPLFRAIATSASILMSVAWLTWQGSAWVADMRHEMREVRSALMSISKTVESKAATSDLVSAIKDVTHRFDLLCARAPKKHRAWVCIQKI